jgi:hypothetical protein
MSISDANPASQLDFFRTVVSETTLDFPVAEKPARTTLLVGLTVEIANGDCPQCHGNLAVVREGKGPHAAELSCLACNHHRGWVSKSTAKRISEVVKRFGMPREPIIFRRGI